MPWAHGLQIYILQVSARPEFSLMSVGSMPFREGLFGRDIKAQNGLLFAGERRVGLGCGRKAQEQKRAQSLSLLMLSFSFLPPVLKICLQFSFFSFSMP